MIAQKEGERAQLLQLAAHLDKELKHILDPLGVFGSNSKLKGLESAF
jgi:cell division protein ZapA (FtsZ GTPase activity inhibitor)